MSAILNVPVAVFVISFVLFWLSVFLGFGLSKIFQEEHEIEKDDLSLVTNASLTLLALIIGFSFSMALSRYDQRKNYEEEGANAIGTEYFRAGLLPAADARHLRELLTQFLDLRLLFYSSRDADRLSSVAKETALLENDMWSTVQAAATTNPTPPMALVVSGLNDVLNREGYTEAAWVYRVPIGAWSTMILFSIGCCLLIGFGARRKRFLLVFPVLVALSFFFIADIDSPRRGVIRVIPQNLISLAKSLHSE